VRLSLRLCVWLCLWALSCLLQQHPHPSRRHFWSVKYVRQNATTYLSLWQEHSLADKVSMLQPQPSGMRFLHISAHHPLWTVYGWSSLETDPDVLHQLHWLAMRQRIMFKIATPVYRSLSGNAAGYLINDCQLSSSPTPMSDDCVLPTLKHSLSVGRAAVLETFATAGPQVCNNLFKSFFVLISHTPQCCIAKDSDWVEKGLMSSMTMKWCQLVDVS